MSDPMTPARLSEIEGLLRNRTTATKALKTAFLAPAFHEPVDAALRMAGLTERELADAVPELLAEVERLTTDLQVTELENTNLTIERDHYRTALVDIEDEHLPSQPAALNLPPYDWAVSHIKRLRRMARDALKGTP